MILYKWLKKCLNCYQIYSQPPSSVRLGYVHTWEQCGPRATHIACKFVALLQITLLLIFGNHVGDLWSKSMINIVVRVNIVRRGPLCVSLVTNWNWCWSDKALNCYKKIINGYIVFLQNECYNKLGPILNNIFKYDHNKCYIQTCAQIFWWYANH